MKYAEIDKYITANLGDIDAFVFLMKIEDLLPMYYVAVRGRDSVEGAVQRTLNTRRINDIKRFVLDGNIFFNSFVLNWSKEDCAIEVSDGKLRIPVVPSSVQVIDGQHR